MADSNRLQGAGSEGAPGLGRMSMGRGPNKYDNAHNIGGPNMSGQAYDDKKAYDKNLPAKERMHYMENAAHDKKGGTPMYGKGSPLTKHFKRNSK